MARNLGQTSCARCGFQKVRLEEPARLITEAEAGRYFDEFAGLVVANAACPVCETKYLAWIDIQGALDHKDDKRLQEYIDLSFRSTFNDEPSEEDLVYWVDVYRAGNMISRLKHADRPHDPKQVVIIQSVTTVVLTPRL